MAIHGRAHGQQDSLHHQASQQQGPRPWFIEATELPGKCQTHWQAGSHIHTPSNPPSLSTAFHQFSQTTDGMTVLMTLQCPAALFHAI